MIINDTNNDSTHPNHEPDSSEPCEGETTRTRTGASANAGASSAAAGEEEDANKCWEEIWVERETGINIYTEARQLWGGN